jgi:hypothetical protein
MHIGIDISLLRIAQAGVLTYHRALLNHLVRVGRDCHFTLIDVLPLNPGRPMAPLAALDAPNVRVVRCPGIRRGYLSARPAFHTDLRIPSPHGSTVCSTRSGRRRQSSRWEWNSALPHAVSRCSMPPINSPLLRPALRLC